MSSGGHRSFTVVTIVTMIFAPIFAHHHWFYNLVSVKTDTQVVACAVHQPCPASQFVLNVIKPDLPTTPPPGQSAGGPSGPVQSGDQQQQQR